MTGKTLSFLEGRRMEIGPAGTSSEGRHWRLAIGENSVAWLVLDKQDASANTLSGDVLRELGDRLGEIESSVPKALVIRSAKPSGFVAGADIAEFKGITDENEITARLKEGHAVLDRLERLECPTIAVIHGYALGGGLELALACDYRIAIDGATVGFPEVRLGLHPGLGGTFRLTELIDPLEAMTLMLTGKTAHTRKAKDLGIVDLVMHERHVLKAIEAIVAGDVEKYERGLKAVALKRQPARAYAAKQMRSRTQVKAPKKHYPAPHALIDLWEEHGGSRTAMREGEITTFTKLVTGSTAQNLVRVYFLRENLKEIGKQDSGISHVHVIGAGSMGAEIAAWCAIRGLDVTLGDVKNEAIAAAIAAAAKLCDDRHLSNIEKRDALDRLIPDPRGAGIGRADLIIEAVSEKPDLKKQIYADIEPRMKKDAILASNTSSLKLSELASDLANPSRFAGLHFFNPVAKLELVEVVSHEAAEPEVLARLRAFTGDIDRLPAPVTSYPGFLVNRALMPYLMEALILVDEGIDKETIDKAAENFGMPMGPIEVADQVGLDICLDVAESLRRNIEKPMPEIPQWFRDMVEKGNLGRKTGRGFYVWEDGHAKKGEVENAPPEEIADRLLLPMLDACVECLREGVVETEDIVDGALIFATGFAPFRGGPMHYARTRGSENITTKMKQLAELHGNRFKPDAGWSRFT